MIPSYTIHKITYNNLLLISDVRSKEYVLEFNLVNHYFKSVYLVIALSWIYFVHFKSVMEHVKVNQKYVDNVAIGHIIFHEKHI